MILSTYEKTVDSLTSFIEDNIHWGRTNEIFMGFASDEMLDAEQALVEDFAECFLAKKDVIRVEKGLISLVKELENGNDSEEFYIAIEKKFFNPFTCKPLCILYSDWGHLIEKSVIYDKIRKEAIAETQGINIEFQENRLFSAGLEEQIASFLERMDILFNMVLEKKDRIDILIYLKNNIL